MKRNNVLLILAFLLSRFGHSQTLVNVKKFEVYPVKSYQKATISGITADENSIKVYSLLSIEGENYYPLKKKEKSGFGKGLLSAATGGMVGGSSDRKTKIQQTPLLSEFVFDKNLDLKGSTKVFASPLNTSDSIIFNTTQLSITNITFLKLAGLKAKYPDAIQDNVVIRSTPVTSYKTIIANTPVVLYEIEQCLAFKVEGYSRNNDNGYISFGDRIEKPNSEETKKILSQYKTYANAYEAIDLGNKNTALLIGLDGKKYQYFRKYDLLIFNDSLKLMSKETIEFPFMKMLKNVVKIKNGKGELVGTQLIFSHYLPVLGGGDYKDSLTNRIEVIGLGLNGKKTFQTSVIHGEGPNSLSPLSAILEGDGTIKMSNLNYRKLKTKIEYLSLDTKSGKVDILKKYSEEEEKILDPSAERLFSFTDGNYSYDMGIYYLTRSAGAGNGFEEYVAGFKIVQYDSKGQILSNLIQQGSGMIQIHPLCVKNGSNYFIIEDSDTERILEIKGEKYTLSKPLMDLIPRTKNPEGTDKEPNFIIHKPSKENLYQNFYYDNKTDKLYVAYTENKPVRLVGESGILAEIKF